MSSSESQSSFVAAKKSVVTFSTDRPPRVSSADACTSNGATAAAVVSAQPKRSASARAQGALARLLVNAAATSAPPHAQPMELKHHNFDDDDDALSRPEKIAAAGNDAAESVDMQCRPPLLFDGLLADPTGFEEPSELDPSPVAANVEQAHIGIDGDLEEEEEDSSVADGGHCDRHFEHSPSFALPTLGDSIAVKQPVVVIEPPPLESSILIRREVDQFSNLEASAFCSTGNPLTRPLDDMTNTVMHERLMKFLARLSVDNDSSRCGLIEVHRLKRVAHAAKLTSDQRKKLIPPHVQTKKLIPVDVCVKCFVKHAKDDLHDAEIILVALEALNDAVVASQESVLSRIEERLAKVVSDNRAKFADNLFRNVWDTVHLLSIVVFYVVALEQNVLHLNTDYVATHDGSSWVLALFISITVFWALDVAYSTQVLAIDRDGRLIKDPWAIIQQRRPQLIIDGVALLPIDFILEASSAPFGVFLAFRVLRFVKILRLSYLYELVNRDIVTPALVVFHFQIKKVLIGISWLVLLILTFGAVHNLIDKYSIAPQYGARKYPLFSDSVVAVCVILSGSNAEFEVWVAGDKVLYIGLAILSMIGIGLIVGQLTSLVFTNSVSAENYQLMRDTLGIVEHYNVPRAIQREVLSFQMHALNDDVVRHMSNLAQLPLQMQQEIMMYIKIDAVAKVKLFSGAPMECQMVLASSLSRCIVEPEVEIVRHGEVGTEMYMMAHGYADVILGNGKVITTFSRGDCFGEMALVQKDALRTATVRALTYCDLWTLAKDAFLEALAVYPEFAKTIEDEVVKRSGNVEELRASVFAVNQELLKFDNEGFRAKTGEPPLVSVEAVGSGQSDQEAAADLDVHVEHGLTSHWSTNRRATFRRMSMDTRNPSSGLGIGPSLFRGASNVLRKPSTIAKDDSIGAQVQDALKAIEAAKERLQQERVMLPTLPPAGLRRRSLFGPAT